MIKLKRMIILIAVLVFAINSWAQETTITGVVTSAEEENPIVNVDIRLKGALEVSSRTDNAGRYTITIPANSSNVLIFTHQDFDAAEVNVLGKSIANVKMYSAIRRNQYGQIVTRQQLSAESHDGFIAFESKDKNFKFWFDNRVYLDGATFFDNYDNNLTEAENKDLYQINVPGQLLKLRRMRFAIKANVGDNWYGEIDFDFDGNIVDIKDAYLRRYFGQTGSPWGHISIGQFRMPQGMQQNTSSRHLKLMERASAYEFNPNRKLGIAWKSWNETYYFGFGLHTEEIRNEHDRIEGDPYYFKSPDSDNYGEIDYMQSASPMLGLSTRGVYYFKNETGKLLSLGLGYSARTPGLYKHPDKRIKYDPKDETRVSELEFAVAKIGGVKLAHNLNVDAAISRGPWRMTGEYYYNILTMESGDDAINFSGFYIQSAYLLTGENHPWNYREGEFTQVKAKDKSGAWEIAARYSYINLNDFDRGQTNGQTGQYTIGLNYYATNNVKFMLNYSYVNHDRYADGSGDYKGYIDENGTGFDYSFIAWRCQISF